MRQTATYLAISTAITSIACLLIVLVVSMSVLEMDDWRPFLKALTSYAIPLCFFPMYLVSWIPVCVRPFSLVTWLGSYALGGFLTICVTFFVSDIIGHRGGIAIIVEDLFGEGLHWFVQVLVCSAVVLPALLIAGIINMFLFAFIGNKLNKR